MSLYLKWATVAVALVLICLAIEIWRTGRQLSRKRTPQLVRKHKGYVWTAFVVGLVVVFLIEWQVRNIAGGVSNSPLFYCHLVIVGVLVVLFGAIIWQFNGVRRPRLHKPLVYLLFVLCALTVITGGVLLYQLPSASS